MPELYDSSQEIVDKSGRNLMFHLHKEAPGFLLRNHRSNTEEPISIAPGASSSVFCYIPYGNDGGYGGRFAPNCLLHLLPTLSTASMHAYPQLRP
jgi:hypothetical protein